MKTRNWIQRILDPDELTGGTEPISPPSETPPRPRPPLVISLEQMQTMAAAIAQSGMFGVKTESQALSLMLLCQAEGLHPALAVRRYHIIDGKPAMRADALQGEFEQTGAILWHERNEQECSATFFRDKRQVTGEALKRALGRYLIIKRGEGIQNFAAIGEITIVRTMEDAIAKKLAMSFKDGKWQMKWNWMQSPRQMLHARCLSEGVRAISPGLVAGIYTEDETFDILPDDGSVMTAEDRVLQATENAASVPNATFEIVDPVSEENYNEVTCHIGKAEGGMLGKTVREIHPNVLQWLSHHFGDGEGIRWGNPPNEKDERLKQAVDMALKKLSE